MESTPTMGTSPWFHDIIHTGNPGDLAFYAALVRPGTRVLELGCGAGRISMALARRGALVTGIDLDPSMIEEAKRRAKLEGHDEAKPFFVGADMSDFELDEKFNLVIVPYNALLCLLDEERLASCLERVSRHLERDGRFAFDIYDPGEPFEGEPEPDDEEELSPLISLTEGETEIRIFERALPSEDPRRMDTGYIFEATDEAGSRVYEHRLPQRAVYPAEVPRLLAAAGLELTETLPDFRRGEIDDDTLQVAFIAKKK